MGRYLILSFYVLSMFSALGAASISHTNIVPNLIVLTNSFVKEETVQDGLTLGGVRLTAWPAGTGDLIAANGMTNLAPLLGAGGVVVQATNAAGFKVNVGLDNVDNTSDANKPVSSATQTALDGKVSKAGDTMTGAAVQAEGNYVLGLNTSADWAMDETLVPQFWIANNGSTNLIFTPDGGLFIGKGAWTTWAGSNSDILTALRCVENGDPQTSIAVVGNLANADYSNSGAFVIFNAVSGPFNGTSDGRAYLEVQTQDHLGAFFGDIKLQSIQAANNGGEAFNGLIIRDSPNGSTVYAKINPWAPDNGTVPHILGTFVSKSSGNLFEIKNNTTNEFAVGWDGSIYSPKLTASRLTVSTSSNTLSSVSTTGLVDGTGTAADASDVTGALNYTPLNKAGDTLTGNLFTELGAGVTNYVDFTYASRTNLLTANIAFAHATNAVTAKHSSHVRWMLNASGGNLTFAIPAAWKTNVYSAVPPALTNGTITKMIVEAWGDTATAANQTNCFVAFEFYK